MHMSLDTCDLRSIKSSGSSAGLGCTSALGVRGRTSAEDLRTSTPVVLQMHRHFRPRHSIPSTACISSSVEHGEQETACPSALDG